MINHVAPFKNMGRSRLWKKFKREKRAHGLDCSSANALNQIVLRLIKSYRKRRILIFLKLDTHHFIILFSFPVHEGWDTSLVKKNLHCSLPIVLGVKLCQNWPCQCIYCLDIYSFVYLSWTSCSISLKDKIHMRSWKSHEKAKTRTV